MRADRQRGAALLLALLVVAMGSLALFVSQLSPNGARRSVERQTATALARAKEALIGRALTDDNRPGSLPCPASDENGQAALFAGNRCPTLTGRFPWKTMKTGELRDGHGELLWYVLAATLRDHQAAEPINSQTPTDLIIDGESQIAAILIAPGPALADQAGRPSDAASDYLDAGNADGDTAFVSPSAAAHINDSLLAIRRDELFRLVGRRVLGELRGAEGPPGQPPDSGLRRHHREFGSFPWADGDDDGRGDAGVAAGRIARRDLLLPEWIERNQWHALVGYVRTGSDSAGLAIGGTTLAVVPCAHAPCP